MVKKVYNLVLGNDFLRSSAVVFGSNLSVGVLNYLLVIFASRALLDEYSVWTALTGLFAMLTTFNTGLYTEINKKFAAYAKENNHKAVGFYDFLMTRARTLVIIGLVLSPVLGLLLQYFSQVSTTPIMSLIVITIFLSIYTGLNRFLLIGMKHNLKFGIVSITQGLARFIPTVILFEMGVKIWALPIGLLTSQVLSYLVGLWYVQKIRKPIEEQATKKKYRFTLKPHLIASLKSTIILFFLATFLNIAPIIAEGNLTTENKDLFAVLFNFGQIIHFGSTAFTQAIVVHAATSKGNKIYYFSVGLMTALTSMIGGVFYFFGELMLTLFDRTQYVDQLGLILYYSLFIVMYNIIFISVQYLISHSKYRVLWSLPVFCAVLVGGIYYSSTTTTSLMTFITTQIGIGAAVAAVFFVYITLDDIMKKLKRA